MYDVSYNRKIIEETEICMKALNGKSEVSAFLFKEFNYYNVRHASNSVKNMHGEKIDKIPGFIKKVF